jgi:hypothetical protein
VATRRRGGADLDDLKARLGLQEPSGDQPAAADAADADADEGQEAGEDGEGADAPAAATAADAGPAQGGSAPVPAAPPSAAPVRPAAPAPRPAPAPVAHHEPAEDYASAVHDEAPVVATLDASAVEQGLVAPGTSKVLPLIVTAIACIFVGIVLGHFASSTNSARELVNGQTRGAQSVLGDLEPTAQALSRLSGTLGGIQQGGYTPDFESALRGAYGETQPVLDPNALVSAGPLLTHDPTLSRRLIAFAIRTQYLQALVGSHLRRTEGDAAEIARELEAGSQTRGLGVAFDFLGAVTAYNAWLEAPDQPFRPPGAERVEYDALDLVDVADPANPTATVKAYNVFTSQGEAIQIPPQDMVVLPRAQLLPSITTETPVSRYAARTAQIREELDAIVAEQDALAEALRELASRELLGTF